MKWTITTKYGTYTLDTTDPQFSGEPDNIGHVMDEVFNAALHDDTWVSGVAENGITFHFPNPYAMWRAEK